MLEDLFAELNKASEELATMPKKQAEPALVVKEATFRTYSCHICGHKELQGRFGLACHMWHYHYDTKRDLNYRMRRKVENYTENALRTIKVTCNAVQQEVEDLDVYSCECGDDFPNTAVHFTGHILRRHVRNRSITGLPKETKQAFHEAWKNALPAFNHFYQQFHTR